jgi:hypothetical protein
MTIDTTEAQNMSPSDKRANSTVGELLDILSPIQTTLIR